MSAGRPIAIITRPREDSLPLAEALAAQGFDPLIEPMLQIRPRAAPLPDPKEIQALLFSSANGLRALIAQTGADLSYWLDRPAFCVGDASARLARASGFGVVFSADGDVGDLAQLAAQQCDRQKGPLLHLSGSDIAGDLAATLGREGFSVERLVLYSAEPAGALSPALQEALLRDQAGLALFFSPRTAGAFVTLCRAAGLADRLAMVTAGALSPAVAQALTGVTWKNVLIAQRPRQEALLAAISGV